MGYDGENSTLRPEMPYTVFDVETVPMPGCEPFIELEGIEAPSNWKDPEKIAAYVADKRRKLIDSAGLDLDLCEIACIGWENESSRGGVASRALYDEADLLRMFWKAVGDSQLVGFNVWHFDLPVLVRRSQYLGILTPQLRLETRWPDSRVVDVAYALSFGRIEMRRSLDFYCKRFGVDHDDTVTGADIAGLVAAGDWKAVHGHCYADVFSTHLLAKKLGLVRQAVAA